ncbi:FkbM family methyltransferase [Zestomonas carbonaria]|uniref:D-inositol-3-phosphate glycosyltransferase n=1 Tax=Zestomonas carbonaria TaxID=2762745 RepID=A0A7U7EKM7_9GAMM|nr:FkbM family methyltransferase [Pseudomonas carbonaria]CAD5105890.1 D-inositol-3-phosphate glycosyltransferase [Pseudomonas carbonaria]
MSFVSHAQNFEDVMLWRALKDVEHGFYIDIGAQDPVVDSVSLAFYEHGWRGVHVEPTRQYSEKLRERRPDEVVEQVAIGNARGLLGFYEFRDTGLSTADPELAERHMTAGFAATRTEVPVVTLDEVLEKHGERAIHWLKIDVEGWEQSVLESWHSSSVRPWVLVIESTLPGTQVQTHFQWEPLVLAKGYRFVHFDGLNRFYLHEDRLELQAAFDCPPNVFDGFLLSGTASQSFCKLLEERQWQAEERVREQDALIQRAEDLRHAAEQALQERMALQAQAEAKQAAAESMSEMQQLRAGELESQLQQVRHQLDESWANMHLWYQQSVAHEAQARQLQLQLNESLSDAHNWQQQSVAHEAQARQLQQQLNESLSNAHHWHLQANAQEVRVNALLGSTSWRITWPLRIAMEGLRGLVRLPWRMFKALLRPVALLAMRAVLRRPGLRQRLAGCLRRCPRVFQHLRRFAMYRGLLREVEARPPKPPAAESAGVAARIRSRGGEPDHAGTQEVVLRTTSQQGAEMDSLRIVIDMQGAQGGNGMRGIGRYSLALALAIVRNRGGYEVFLVLNGRFPETIEPIRATFRNLLPRDRIHVWNAPGPVSHVDPDNTWRRQSAELVREAFIASLDPSIVLVTSLFEGMGDDAVTSIGSLSRTVPTAAMLYDLIPLINRSPYLDDPRVAQWYEDKLDHLRRADLLLAISESSRQEGIDRLDMPVERISTISTAADAQFRIRPVGEDRRGELRQRYGLERPYAMYTGGIDHRKNIEGLIRAYALLPARLRQRHQLAIVCSIRPEDRARLEALASEQGLAKGELVLTGYVPEEDLVDLYNLCKVFVFPSRHEGFGLPALEAMACGRAVIGSNTSSLPEVIGCEKALFDPFDDASIADRLRRVLSDSKFRRALKHHAQKQAGKFSWDRTARLAIAAMEKTVAQAAVHAPHRSLRRPRLAYVSPMPPERSGISDYSAALIPELARHYEIEVVVVQETVAAPWITANCPIRTVAWFREHAARFDRVLYHFGNSAFHQHMFALLEEVPGVVVLHDFFLSGIVAHMECQGAARGVWVEALYRGHGYTAVRQRFQAVDTAEVVWKYPCNHAVLRNAQGVIVHSENSRRLARQWYGAQAARNWAHIPLLRIPDPWDGHGRENARAVLGLRDGDFVVCSFGMLGPSKLNHRLLDAWLASPLAADVRCLLVFVGESVEEYYGQKMLGMIAGSAGAERIRITGWTDAEVFEQYLAAADIGVQLRTLSRGETSAAVLDCMNHGLATIVNANGCMADLEDDSVWKLPDEFTDEQLSEALTVLWRDPARRRGLGSRAREIVRTRHAPGECAEQYFTAIEGFHRAAATAVPALVGKIAQLDSAPTDDGEWAALASAIGGSITPPLAQRQLLVDISELVQRDARSGIQRVVRSILLEWLLNPPPGYRVEPVYATAGQPGYRYARRFTLGFLGCPETTLVDEPISYRAGDVFVGLDLQPEVVLAQDDLYQRMRRQGVSVQFVVYDLLILQFPHCFPEGSARVFEGWLNVVARSDGALCISRAVADDLSAWLERHGAERGHPFRLDWFHLGADVDQSAPTTGLPDDSASVLAGLRARPSFLMVGTVEPRKGYAQALEAFERLWSAGLEVNLVIVGKQGWMVDELAARLRSHPGQGRRLFWLEGISDEYLEQVYATSTCLVAASHGEGFGLPLLEAAQHGLPVIARDIPVFREVAGERAHYFAGMAAEDLARAVTGWLELYRVGRHPASGDIPWLTWKESAERLEEILLKDEWSAQ